MGGVLKLNRIDLHTKAQLDKHKFFVMVFFLATGTWSWDLNGNYAESPTPTTMLPFTRFLVIPQFSGDWELMQLTDPMICPSELIFSVVSPCQDDSIFYVYLFFGWVQCQSKLVLPTSII